MGSARFFRRGAGVSVLALCAAIGALLAAAPQAAIGARGAAGRVRIAGSLGGRPLFLLSAMRPGVPSSRCLSLRNYDYSAVSLSLYASVRAGGLGEDLRLSVTRGGRPARKRGSSCAGFQGARNGTLFTGRLANLPRTADRAVRDHARLRARATRAYRFTVVLANAPSAEGRRAELSFVLLARGAGAGARLRSSRLRARASLTVERWFPPQNLSPPRLTGSAAIGQTLRARPGSWSQSPSSYGYAWQRCASDGGGCVSIPDATGAVYAPQAADVGHTLRVLVSALNAGGDSSPAASLPSASVPPDAQTPPQVEGAPAVGQTLSADTSGWIGQGLSFSYQWQRCDQDGGDCVPIPGANESTYVPQSSDRLDTIVVSETASAAGTSATASSQATDPVALSVNPIVVENEQPGTSAWQLPASDSSATEGYPTSVGVQPGQTLQLHVSTPAGARYRVYIYRLGWYRGDGGRLIACLPSCSSDEPGSPQPVPAPEPGSGYLNAGWPVTDSITVASDWTSGYYLAEPIVTQGPYTGQGGYIPFIVSAPPGSSSAILVQASVNTWEAYNTWGGKSLYDFNSTDQQQATSVSFERPLLDVTDGQGLLQWEYPLARFLEREGYDVSYQTDIDTDEYPATLLGHRLDIVSGHDEYWSSTMRSAFDSARGDGVNLAFIGGDIGYWQMRYADSDQTEIEYRSASADPDPNPSQKTESFDSLGMPECELLGVAYQGGLDQSGTDAAGNYTIQYPASTNAWFTGTGLTYGETLSDAVGYEWDGIQSGCSVPALTDLMHWEGPKGQNADMVTYQAASGAQVVSDGTLNLTFALDNYGHPQFPENPAVQELFTNILDSLSGS